MFKNKTISMIAEVIFSTAVLSFFLFILLMYAFILGA